MSVVDFASLFRPAYSRAGRQRSTRTHLLATAKENVRVQAAWHRATCRGRRTKEFLPGRPDVPERRRDLRHGDRAARIAAPGAPDHSSHDAYPCGRLPTTPACQPAARSSTHRGHNPAQRCQADICANTNTGAIRQRNLDPVGRRSDWNSRAWCRGQCRHRWMDRQWRVGGDLHRREHRCCLGRKRTTPNLPAPVP
jgi:hypothetical protein